MKIFDNKKVLLCDRKRRTARSVAYQGDWGYPCSLLGGCPSYILGVGAWGGRYSLSGCGGGGGVASSLYRTCNRTSDTTKGYHLPCERTDTYENITFPILRMQVVIKSLIISSILVSTLREKWKARNHKCPII